MKRAELLRHLHQHRCLFYREGKKHTIYINPRNSRLTSIPRHREISDFLVIRICLVDLVIPLPRKKG